MLARQGLILGREELADWLGTAARKVLPVVRRLHELLLASPQLFADETTLPVLAMEAEKVLAGQVWRRIAWQYGTKGALAARLTAARIRVGDGPIWGNNRHLPGDGVWQVGEWRSGGARKY